MTFEFPDGLEVCECGHGPKLHYSEKGGCWGDPRDMNLTLCPCIKFSLKIKIYRVVTDTVAQTELVTPLNKGN